MYVLMGALIVSAGINCYLLVLVFEARNIMDRAIAQTAEALVQVKRYRSLCKEWEALYRQERQFEVPEPFPETTWMN